MRMQSSIQMLGFNGRVDQFSPFISSARAKVSLSDENSEDCWSLSVYRSWPPESNGHNAFEQNRLGTQPLISGAWER